MGTSAPHDSSSGFPVGAGVLLGVGLGGFFDGILVHQILQWHHLLEQRGLPTGQRPEPASQHTLGRPFELLPLTCSPSWASPSSGAGHAEPTCTGQVGY